MQSNFLIWHDNFADMPLERHGKWVDLETGFEYDASWDYANNRPFGDAKPGKHDAEIKTARATAKASGLVALTGSTKQKGWAEQIRQKRILSASLAISEALGGELFKKASFWIGTRDAANFTQIADSAIVANDHLMNIRGELTAEVDRVTGGDRKVRDFPITPKIQALMSQIASLEQNLDEITNPKSPAGPKFGNRGRRP